MNSAAKKKRQAQVLELIRHKRIASQRELQRELSTFGISCNQGVLSRDLYELAVVKFQGTYRLPDLPSASKPKAILAMLKVGENLIVLRTHPGQASAVALAIDKETLEEIAGTIAGDDTVFVAVYDKSAQNRAFKMMAGFLVP